MEQIITEVHKRIQSADAEYYAVGKALMKLDRPSVLAAFGVGTFDAFLDAHVIPSATAHRYMSVAKHYPEVTALKLGVHKAYHLAQYAKVARTRATPAQLAERDSAIGKERRRVSTLTAADIQAMVRSKRGTEAKAALPKPTRLETRTARAVARQVEALLGVDATVRVNKKKDLVRLEMRLSELLE